LPSSTTSCQTPVRGSQGNGSVMGYYYQDSTGHPLGHTASFTYDNVNPLNNAQATGGVNYNLTFGVGRYAKMSCKTNVQTQGLCTNLRDYARPAGG